MKSGIIIKNEPYLILNIVFAGVIMLIMLYSGIFSPDTGDYPVVCIHEKLTGQPCASCRPTADWATLPRSLSDPQGRASRPPCSASPSCRVRSCLSPEATGHSVSRSARGRGQRPGTQTNTSAAGAPRPASTRILIFPRNPGAEGRR